MVAGIYLMLFIEKTMPNTALHQTKNRYAAFVG